jgi:hypothetical protein
VSFQEWRVAEDSNAAAWVSKRYHGHRTMSLTMLAQVRQAQIKYARTFVVNFQFIF